MTAAKETILERIVADVRARLAASPVDVGQLEERALAAPKPRDGLASLSADGVRVIAEVKRMSPSEGAIKVDTDPVAVARIYDEAGAAAISVLTEPDHFGGSLVDLAQVSAAVDAPTLRKDFIVDRRQLAEARLGGASLVLLIVSVLSDGELLALREQAERLGLHALVEAHDAVEVARAIDSGARIVGVNNRNLATFDVDLAVSERLRSGIPHGIIAVSESGIHTPEDITRLRRSGYDVFLVGTSLMRAEDPRASLAAMVAG